MKRPRQQRRRNAHKQLLREVADMAADMCAAALSQGHEPLFLVSGKELGGGHRVYSIAAAGGHVSREHIAYIVGRLQKQLDGTLRSEAEAN